MIDQIEYSNEYQEQCRLALDKEKNKSLKETNNWEHVDRDNVHKDWATLFTKLAEMVDTYSPPDQDVQKIVSEHYKITSRFYKPSKEAYIGTSLFVIENDDFLKYHNSFHPKLAEFLGAAMRVFAERNL